MRVIIRHCGHNPQSKLYSGILICMPPALNLHTYNCRRIDDDKGRTHELAQSAVKCMRGILACWIRQADKVWNSIIINYLIYLFC